MSQQTKRWSLLESSIATLFGYFLAVGTQQIIFPYYGWEISIQQSIEVAFIFTLISFLRSYVVRGAFNWLHSKGYGGIRR